MCEYHGFILSTGKQAICSDKEDDALFVKPDRLWFLCLIVDLNSVN